VGYFGAKSKTIEKNREQQPKRTWISFKATELLLRVYKKYNILQNLEKNNGSDPIQGARVSWSQHE
jgi:hypothetical protein